MHYRRQSQGLFDPTDTLVNHLHKVYLSQTFPVASLIMDPHSDTGSGSGNGSSSSSSGMRSSPHISSEGLALILDDGFIQLFSPIIIYRIRKLLLSLAIFMDASIFLSYFSLFCIIFLYIFLYIFIYRSYFYIYI